MVTRHDTMHALMITSIGDSITIQTVYDLVQTPSSGRLRLLEDKLPSRHVLQFTDLDGEPDHLDCCFQKMFVHLSLIGYGESRAWRTYTTTVGQSLRINVSTSL